MKKISAVAIMATTALLAACGSTTGSGNNNGTIQPLNAQQRARFDQTAQAISESTTWQTPALRSVQAPSNKPAVEKAVGLNCVFTPLQAGQTTPPNPNLPQTTKLGLIVNGSACPIDFSWNADVALATVGEHTTIKSEFHMTYAAKDDLARTLDVRSYKLDNSESIEQDANGGSYVGAGTGRIESASQGVVNLQMNVSSATTANGLSITRVTRFTYADGFAVELKDVTAAADRNQAAVMKYFINNVEVSSKEYMDYLTKLSLTQAHAAN